MTTTDFVELSPAEIAAAEQAIVNCVRQFYAKGMDDTLLGPVFKSIRGLEHHLERIQDFWSHSLLGTTRYSGPAFAPHMKLEVEPEHFTRWMELFEETAHETLSAPLAATAIEKARHMSVCFQTGMFIFTDEHGRPQRLPPEARKKA